MKFGTKAIHAGLSPDPSTGAIMTPIFQTSTFAQTAPGEHLGYDYARGANPTRTALQDNLAALENATFGLSFASGVAATDAVLKCLNPQDHIIACNDLYGGTYRLFTKTYQRFGMTFSFVDMQNLQNLVAAITPQTKLIWIETPTNPLLRIIDIVEVCKIAKTKGITVVVDNTFASPYLQQPLDLGADLVVHSTTKYIGGHSDVIGGAICTNHEEWYENLFFQVRSSGACPSPMDCFLTLRGIKTLHLRMQRHCENAKVVADFLRNHAKVRRVYYPNLPTEEGFEIATRQMKDFGGMLSFELKNQAMQNAIAFMSGTSIFTLAESLGGVESLVNHPATMTHASIPAAERHKAGLSDTLIRLSVGIEDIEDLLTDLDQALSLA